LNNSFGAPINDESILALPDLSGLGGDLDGSFQASNAPDPVQPSQMMYPPIDINSDAQWDLIALGLEEPLPSQDVIDELYVLHAALYSNISLIQNHPPGTLYSSRRPTQCFPSSIAPGTSQA
jgi:hypothetical protein